MAKSIAINLIFESSLKKPMIMINIENDFNTFRNEELRYYTIYSYADRDYEIYEKTGVKNIVPLTIVQLVICPALKIKSNQSYFTKTKH